MSEMSDAAKVAVLVERIDDIERRLAAIEETGRKVSLFVDECSGGRKAMLLLLKIAGGVAALAGTLWGMGKIKVGG